MSNFDIDLTPCIITASNEDLDPLVAYITDAFSETITINDIYKKFAPNHSQYTNLIEKEIRTFGGNSFVNMFRETGPRIF